MSVGYTMTKHALLALNQAARFAGWEDGVRATALCPGATDTDLIAGLPGATPKADRLTPETVAAIVAFLLTLPNQASVPEFIANTRLESTAMTLDHPASTTNSRPGTATTSCTPPPTPPTTRAATCRGAS